MRSVWDINGTRFRCFTSQGNMAILDLDPQATSNPVVAETILRHVAEAGARIAFQGQGWIIVERDLSLRGNGFA